MADDPEAENEHEKEYPGGRVGLNARIIKDKENDAVIIEEINHGYLNDGYDNFLYEDEGTKSTEYKVTVRTAAATCTQWTKNAIIPASSFKPKVPIAYSCRSAFV